MKRTNVKLQVEALEDRAVPSASSFANLSDFYPRSGHNFATCEKLAPQTEISRTITSHAVVSATEPSATAVLSAIHAAFPAARAPAAVNGRTVDFGLYASIQRVEIVSPAAQSYSPRFGSVTARMIGYGEGPLGDALFASLRQNAAAMGIASIQWNGTTFTAGQATTTTNNEPVDRLRIVFAENATVDVNWLKTDFVAQVTNRIDNSTQRGWAVVAIQPQGVYKDPWWIQPNVTLADIKVTSEIIVVGTTKVMTSVGTFTTAIYVGGEGTPTGAPMRLSIFLAGNKEIADKQYPVETQLWELPVKPAASVDFFRAN